MTTLVDRTHLSDFLHRAEPGRVELTVPARTSLADRLAMRAALALLLWSTRPRPTVEDRRRRALADEERLLREAHWQSVSFLTHT